MLHESPTGKKNARDLRHFVCAVLGCVKFWKKKRQSFENVCKQLKKL